MAVEGGKILDIHIIMIYLKTPWETLVSTFAEVKVVLITFDTMKGDKIDASSDN